MPALLTIFTVAGSAAASTRTDSTSPWDSDESQGSTQLTEVVRAEIVEVGEDGALLVEDERTGRQATFQITDGVALRADRKKDFGGRRQLALADLEPGQRVRVTLRKDDGRVLEIRVLELAAA
jgi:hypothetical protein